jgi:hypothetical protein
LRRQPCVDLRASQDLLPKFLYLLSRLSTTNSLLTVRFRRASSRRGILAKDPDARRSRSRVPYSVQAHPRRRVERFRNAWRCGMRRFDPTVVLFDSAVVLILGAVISSAWSAPLPHSSRANPIVGSLADRA